MNGRPAKVHKTTRRDTIWPRHKKKHKQEEIASWDEGKTARRSPKQRNLLTFRPKIQNLKVISDTTTMWCTSHRYERRDEHPKVDKKWKHLKIYQPGPSRKSIPSQKWFNKRRRTGGIPVQFGFLMDLCHLQHSELERYL